MLIISRNLVLAPSIWHPDLQSALSILPGKWLYILPVFMLASLYFLSQTTHVQQRDTDLDGLPAIWSSKDFFLLGTLRFRILSSSCPQTEGPSQLISANLNHIFIYPREPRQFTYQRGNIEIWFYFDSKPTLDYYLKVIESFSSCSNMAFIKFSFYIF